MQQIIQSLTESEKKDADRLIEICRKRISENDSTVTGFNVGMNSSELHILLSKKELQAV